MDVNSIHKQARQMGACPKLKGSENLAELFELFTSIQGIEFAAKYNWPTLEILRQFDGKEALDAEVYIDKGDIMINGARKVVLVGNTRATLVFDDNADTRHEVIVMYGAHAEVNASNWAVVFTENLGGTINKHKEQHAIIL